MSYLDGILFSLSAITCWCFSRCFSSMVFYFRYLLFSSSLHTVLRLPPCPFVWMCISSLVHMSSSQKVFLISILLPCTCPQQSFSVSSGISNYLFIYLPIFSSGKTLITLLYSLFTFTSTWNPSSPKLLCPPLLGFALISGGWLLLLYEYFFEVPPCSSARLNFLSSTWAFMGNAQFLGYLSSRGQGGLGSLLSSATLKSLISFCVCKKVHLVPFQHLPLK